MSVGKSAAFSGFISQHYPENLDENAIVVPVGLEFGPTWIHACFSIVSIEEAEGEYWTGVPSSQIFKDFYQETLSKMVQSHLDPDDFFQSAAPLVPTEERSTELVQAFARHIEEARRMCIWALDKNPLLNFKVMAITVPEHWDVSARTIVAKAASLAGQALESSSMILKQPQAIISAYKMRKNEEGRGHTVLVFYHKTHLHLMLVQMLEAGFVVKGQVYFPHLGEDAIMKASVVSSAGGSKNTNLRESSPGEIYPREDLKWHSYTKSSPTEHFANKGPSPERPNLEEPFEALTFEALAPKDLTPEPSTSTLLAQDDTASSQEDTDHQTPPYRGDLKPILEALQKFLIVTTLSHNPVFVNGLPQVLKYAVTEAEYLAVDGEAHPMGKEALRAAIRETFAKIHWLDVKEAVHDCGAYGAKIAAQMQLGIPKHLGNWEDLPGYIPEQDP